MGAIKLLTEYSNILHGLCTVSALHTVHFCFAQSNASGVPMRNIPQVLQWLVLSMQSICMVMPVCPLRIMAADCQCMHSGGMAMSVCRLWQSLLEIGKVLAYLHP